VTQQGGSISPQAAKLLAEFAGGNLWVLANEIEKLLLYTSGRCIERNDVEQVTSYAREANVFTLVDAISEHCAPKSRQQLHHLLAEGAAPSFLLVMLTRQFRLIIQAKELSDLSLSTLQIQKRLNLSPNYPLTKLMKQASNLSWTQLIESYQRLLETDLAIKTGKWGGELALDLLVSELCADN
jgi:DNA polymerase-3 subunit delta